MGHFSVATVLATAIFLMFVIGLVLIIHKHEMDKKWLKEYKKKPYNFPIKYRGGVFWVSRSVATTLLPFCKDKDGEWCVLANKRGKGCPDYQGYWNVICGYLEGLTGEQNSQKELYEECGIEVDETKIKFVGLTTSPKENKQNVSIRYYTILDGVTDDYKLTSEHSEKDEVEDIKFIKLSEIDNYTWAFNHLNLIKSVSKNIGLNKK